MRIIAHLDLDAFFASVEERDRPRLHGLPIVVGADPRGGEGRGIVSTANYKAREYGIRSALPISIAWRLSETARRAGKLPAVFLEPDFQKYAEASNAVFSIIKKQLQKRAVLYSTIVEHNNDHAGFVGRAPLIEKASIDEAYLDVTFTGSYGDACELANRIKADIKEREQLTCSIGVGPNKLIAKIASDAQKPDGFTLVQEEDAEKFFDPLPLRAIPGVGPKTEEALKRIGVRTVRDAKRFSPEELRGMMGKWGAKLYEKLRGRDESPVVEEYEVKSIGEQETFDTDTRDPNFLSARLKELCADVFRRFKGSGFASFRTVVVTVRFADFITKSRSKTLEAPANSKVTLEFEAFKLLMPFLDARENPKKKATRLVGMRIEKLE